MKTIAIFSNDLSVGGIQKSLYNLLNNIDLIEYQVDVYLLRDNNFYQDKIPKRVNIYYLNNNRKIFMLIPFSLLKLIYRYKGISKAYDIAIDYDSYQPLTAINTLKCQAKKKIMWIHSDWEKKYQYDKKFRISFFFTKKKNKEFDEYVGVSEGVIKPFKKINKLNQKKFRIIPNLINKEEILKKATEECKLMVDTKNYNLCSVGSMVYAKGFDLLIDYIKDLTKYRKNFHLYLIGDGPERKKLEEQVKEYKIDNYVTFLGYQKNPYKYMNLMDGFILTSRYEGQGMVLWEAKVLGLEIFMTKNLEKYNPGLEGYKDIVNVLKNAEKKEKKQNNLIDYNKKIIEKINELFEEIDE